MHKKSPTSIQLPPPLRERVTAAMELSGESLNALVIPCVERSLDAVLAEIMARKKEKLMAFYERSEARPVTPGPSASPASRAAPEPTAPAGPPVSYHKNAPTGRKRKARPGR